MTALAHGVPLVVVPLFSFDQHVNAAAVADAGAGVALDGGPAATDRLADALDAVLTDGAFAAGARRVADEIAGLPPVAAGVDVLVGISG
jgi:UDP:flavonoid glycosyltransferase YjiC (YdhE family)